MAFLRSSRLTTGEALALPDRNTETVDGPHCPWPDRSTGPWGVEAGAERFTQTPTHTGLTECACSEQRLRAEVRIILIQGVQDLDVRVSLDHLVLLACASMQLPQRIADLTGLRTRFDEVLDVLIDPLGIRMGGEMRVETGPVLEKLQGAHAGINLPHPTTRLQDARVRASAAS